MTAQTTSTFNRIAKPNLLRRALQGNAIFTALSGLALIVAAKSIAAFIGLNQPAILFGLGLILAIDAVILFREAAREPINRTVAMLAIELDAAWVIGSIVLLVSGWVPFTTAGNWTIAIVADIVAVFAVVQFVGLRRLGK